MEPPAPFRFGPGIYLAQTQPGFEAIAWGEIAARYAGARVHELARRVVPDRVGMTIFSAARADPLKLLRTAEDIFAVVGYRRYPAMVTAAAGGAPGATSKIATETLARVQRTARDARYIDEAIAARVGFVPGSRGGHRLRFRVVARMAGDHPFRRVDFQHAVERGIAERGDRTWRLSEEEADVELWATMFPGETILALRLSDERMRVRGYKVAHLPGSLRPSVAAALAWLSEPAPEDVMLDPMCGAGTVLIERAHLGRYAALIGGDRDATALAAARENVGPRYKPIELHSWEATALALGDASVSKIVTNLPWGMRHGSHTDNRRLYPQLLAEFRRVLKKGGRLVMLTAETRLMADLMRRRLFRAERIYTVSILGAPAAIFIVRAE
ncbi:MAG: RNA methyltransferase [Candidatus Binataceae bacterium]|nr:RNA methyltransferase [Candidatus Binataceae bacterium]